MGILMRARAKLKVGRAVGKDGISASMLRCVPWSALCSILKAFRKLFTLEFDTPSVWRSICIALMPKHQRATDFTEMRALSLLSVMSKWYHSCLIILAASHLRSTTPLCMLYGFAGERRVHEVTAVVKRLAQHGVGWGKSHSCCFASLDVLRAFDHLTVNNLSESMDALSFPPTWPML
jgi:hypothetical protein